MSHFQKQDFISLPISQNNIMKNLNLQKLKSKNKEIENIFLKNSIEENIKKKKISLPCTFIDLFY